MKYYLLQDTNEIYQAYLFRGSDYCPSFISGGIRRVDGEATVCEKGGVFKLKWGEYICKNRKDGSFRMIPANDFDSLAVEIDVVLVMERLLKIEQCLEGVNREGNWKPSTVIF